jgi:DNA-binding XRE family transcriptional regulator
MTQQLDQITTEEFDRRVHFAARQTLQTILSAAGRIGQQNVRPHIEHLLALNDDAFESIVSFRAGYQQAVRENDEAAKAAMIEYASEVLGGVSSDTISEDELRLDPKWDAAFNKADAERASFFDAYFAAKHKAGLSTQREVADAAGISPTTVQQIEARQVRPQFRTIEKLAKAFGVPVTDLVRH